MPSTNAPGQNAAEIREAVSKTPHIPELQSIRGIAALVVVVGHCISYYATPDWWQFAKGLANTKLAVTIFFILSGFVLSVSLTRKSFTSETLGAYYAKRLFRIYPALIFATALALAYVTLLHYDIAVPEQSRWISERFEIERYTLLHITASFAGMLAWLIPPVWTIFIEILASFLLPALAFLLAKRRQTFWFVTVLLVLASITLGGKLYYHLDLYLMDFALGAALLAIDPGPLRRMRERGLPLGAIVVGVVILMITMRAITGVDLRNRWIHLYEAVLAAFVIFSFARVGLTSGWLRHRVAIWLGDISYSVYLLHFTVMCVFAKAFAVFTPALVPSIGGIWAGLLLCVPTFLVAIPLASWTYRNIELPGIDLGRKVIEEVLRHLTLRRVRRDGPDVHPKGAP